MSIRVASICAAKRFLWGGLSSAAPCLLWPHPIPSVDLIYAYSVFSHLSEATALAWVREVGRILRPGGMLIATTLKRAHIDVWERLWQSGNEMWRNILRAADFSATQFRADFEAGKFLYCARGGDKAVLSADCYGEAVISPAYVLRSWPSEFQLYDYVSDDMGVPQAIIVVRKLP